MEQIFIKSAELGGTVFTIVAFLWYLVKRDKMITDTMSEGIEVQKETAKANIQLAIALQRLTDKVDINTTAVGKNNPTINKNTEAISKNTKVIQKKNGN